jgi:hypothetical protein
MIAHVLVLTLVAQAPATETAQQELPPPPPPSGLAAPPAPAPAPAVQAPAPPPAPAPVVAAPPAPPPQPVVSISPRHAGLLIEHKALLDDEPSMRRPIFLMLGSAGLGVAGGLLTYQFVQTQGFRGIASSSEPWIGVANFVGIVLAAAGHVLFGILGTTSMVARVKERDAHARRIKDIEAELDAAGLPTNLPPPQLVPQTL